MSDHAYARLSVAELQAQVEAQVAAADTPTAVLRLCLPSVSADAATGVIGARALLDKIHQILSEEWR